MTAAVETQTPEYFLSPEDENARDNAMYMSLRLLAARVIDLEQRVSH